MTVGNRLVAVVSDLHLGRGNAQDSFVKRYSPTAFSDLLGSLSEWSLSHSADATLVLNGDVFDLWEVVKDDQLEASRDAYAHILDALAVPVVEKTKQSFLHQLNWQLGAIADAHSEFVFAIRRWVQAGRRVHFNVGNHDHFLYLNAAQDAFHAWVKGHVPGAESRVTISRFFYDETTMCYAEHGDQFDGASSRSPLHPQDEKLLDEATGYYFLRFVWNRLEAAGHGDLHSDSLVDQLAALLRLAAKTESRYLVKLAMSDYFRAREALDFALVESPFILTLHKLWQGSHRLSDGASAGMNASEDSTDHVSVTDDQVDAALEKVRVESLTRAKGQVATVAPLITQKNDGLARGLPGQVVVPVSKSLLAPAGLKDRFKSAVAPFPKVRAEQIQLITTGHTHKACYVKNLNSQRCEYANTGSWTERGRANYAWAIRQGEQLKCGMNQVKF